MIIHLFNFMESNVFFSPQKENFRLQISDDPESAHHFLRQYKELLFGELRLHLEESTETPYEDVTPPPFEGEEWRKLFPEVIEKGIKVTLQFRYTGHPLLFGIIPTKREEDWKTLPMAEENNGKLVITLKFPFGRGVNLSPWTKEQMQEKIEIEMTKIKKYMAWMNEDILVHHRELERITEEVQKKLSPA